MSDDLSQPDSLLAVLVEGAFHALGEEAERLGFAEIRLLAIVTCGEAPQGEKDSVVAGFGYDDSRDLIPDLVQHLVVAGRAHGLKVMVAPMGQG